jgi:hypothetical protein
MDRLFIPFLVSTSSSSVVQLRFVKFRRQVSIRWVQPPFIRSSQSMGRRLPGIRSSSPRRHRGFLHVVSIEHRLDRIESSVDLRRDRITGTSESSSGSICHRVRLS